jgi:hypothetical protein
MNVFVLCTGRTGSVTFTKACQHIDNFSASHESRVQFLGEERINFPDNHIEADNRLSWFLGRLDAKYGQSAFYVHLKRGREATALSYNRRWHYKDGIIQAFTYGILMSPKAEGLEYCLDYVDTVNENIELFLKDKPQKMVVNLENIKPDFIAFWEAIGAKGNLDNALEEWDTKHNPSKAPSKNPFVNWLERIKK